MRSSCRSAGRSWRPPLAEMELRDARVEELEVEGLPEFAQDLAVGAGKVWTKAGYKVRLEVTVSTSLWCVGLGRL